jgi:hypothetical protein
VDLNDIAEKGLLMNRKLFILFIGVLGVLCLALNSCEEDSINEPSRETAKGYQLTFDKGLCRSWWYADDSLYLVGGCGVGADDRFQIAGRDWPVCIIVELGGCGANCEYGEGTRLTVSILKDGKTISTGILTATGIGGIRPRLQLCNVE